MGRLTKAHVQYFMGSYFYEAASQIKDVPCRQVVTNFAHLFALTLMEDNLGEFLEDGFFSPTDANLVRFGVKTLLHKLRPEAVAVVDSFRHPDFLLNSSLGKKDGNVYEDLLRRTQASNLNREDVSPVFKELFMDITKDG